MSEVKDVQTDIKVKLSGTDGNAFSIMGTVAREMRRAGVEQKIIKAFYDEATSGDYDHLLQTCHRFVEVE